MKNKIISIVLILVIVVSLITYFKTLSNNNKYVTIIDNNKSKYNMEIEKYLVGVIACEMPALYHEEALKAQSVASRTYALYQSDFNKVLETNTNDQCYINEEEMKDKWGSDYLIYKEKIEKIVEDTSGVVMNKDNKLFKSFYFSTSNGYTESSQDVFKESNITSVSSPWDIDSKNYYREITYEKEYLENILGSFEKIEILKRNNTNHVVKVKVDEKNYTGVEFRKKLGLRSTDFEIEIKGNKYTFKTYGYGHGVGMSQNGANELAKLGKNYQEILKYYYNDITFKNLNV